MPRKWADTPTPQQADIGRETSRAQASCHVHPRPPLAPPLPCLGSRHWAGARVEEPRSGEPRAGLTYHSHWVRVQRERQLLLTAWDWDTPTPWEAGRTHWCSMHALCLPTCPAFFGLGTQDSPIGLKNKRKSHPSVFHSLKKFLKSMYRRKGLGALPRGRSAGEGCHPGLLPILALVSPPLLPPAPEANLHMHTPTHTLEPAGPHLGTQVPSLPRSPSLRTSLTPPRAHGAPWPPLPLSLACLPQAQGQVRDTGRRFGDMEALGDGREALRAPRHWLLGPPCPAGEPEDQRVGWGPGQRWLGACSAPRGGGDGETVACDQGVRGRQPTAAPCITEGPGPPRTRRARPRHHGWPSQSSAPCPSCPAPFCRCPR